MTKDDEDFDFGQLTVRVGKDPKDQTVTRLAVDRLAADESGLIYLLSVVGAQGTVKGLRAALGKGVTATFAVTGVPVSNGHRTGHAHKLRTDEGRKFLVHQHPLGYGQVHALFLSTDPGFMRVASEEAVFAELKRPEYTTPLLRSWAGDVRDDLYALKLLAPLFCFRCSCSRITATTEELDACVSKGIKSGKLLFRELNLVGENP